MKLSDLASPRPAALAGVALGAAVGAALLPLGYRPWPRDPIAAGGPPMAAFGALYGGLLGLGVALGRVRPRLVGAAIGSVLPFAALELNSCDGSILLLPAVGAILGAVSGRVTERV